MVGADNAPAVRLYARAGFVAAGEFELHAGTRSLVMQWDRGRAGGEPSPALAVVAFAR